MNKLSKNKKNTLIDEAWRKIEKGKPEDALDLFDEALQENSKDIEALFGRASANFLMDEPEKTTKDLNSLLKIDNKHQKSYHLRGLIKGNEKKYKDAIKDLKKAVSLDVTNIEALVDLGGAYIVDNDYAGARIIFEKVVKIYGDCPDGWRGLGVSLLFENQFEKAIEKLQKALEKEPDDLDSILAIANAYFAVNDPEKGSLFAKKATTIKKDIFKQNKKESDYDEFDDEDEDNQSLLDSDFED